MKTGQIAKIAAAGLFLLVAISFFLPVVGNTQEVFGVTIKATISGLAMAFGGQMKQTADGISTTVDLPEGYSSILFGFVLILAVIGLVVALLAAFNVIKLDNKIVSFIIIGVAAVMLILCVVSYVTYFGNVEEGVTLKDLTDKEMGMPFGIGFWMALVGSVLAAGAGVFNLLKGNE